MDTKISLPLLPLRDIVVFPSMILPLFVGRDKSIMALNEVMKNELIMLKAERETKDQEIERLIDENAMKDLEIEEIVNKIESIIG